MMRKVYTVAARRTAIGTFDGRLKTVGAVDLGATVARELFAQSNIEPSDMDEVIFGNVLSAGLGQNVARQIASRAGVPFEVPSFTVNKVCASGMKALQLAFQSIAFGEAEAILAGGVENMNQAPYLVNGARFGLGMNDAAFVDSMVRDGLWCAVNGYHMGITAENIAEKYGISRLEQDKYAALSQAKAARAIDDGAFAEEIVPVTIKKRRESLVFEADEHPRKGTTVEILSKLRPAFKQHGTVTAGNASGINDGAAALILASEEFVRSRNTTPLAEFIAFASVGLDPATMGLGPALAIPRILHKTGMSLNDIDIFELNEAFAVQSIAVLRETGIGPEKANVNGGAIALGHPIGASGARIVVTLIQAMKKRGLRTGLASLCIGGGMGMASIVKLID